MGKNKNKNKNETEFREIQDIRLSNYCNHEQNSRDSYTFTTNSENTVIYRPNM